MSQPDDRGISVFSTAPQSSQLPRNEYVETLIQVSRWSEESGCAGMLIYTDNSLVDPWLVSQIVLQNTRRLCPLVAVQPVYMHPYSVAKMVASLAHLHERRICLNMVAGGFRTDLSALCDDTPHDSRYARLFEYTTIVQQLLRHDSPLTFEGSYYRVKQLALKPPLPIDLQPGIFLSGSSEAGMTAARSLGAVAVEYPKQSGEFSQAPPRRDSGIRMGIIAREEKRTAWQTAWQRFPSDRNGQIAHLVAMKLSDSEWHKQLSALEREVRDQESIYWLWPFKNYKTFCPYLVGSYEEVSDELAKYIRAGFTNYILDIPAEEGDLRTSGIVFRRAVEKAAFPVPLQNRDQSPSSEHYSTDSKSVAARPELPV